MNSSSGFWNVDLTDFYKQEAPPELCDLFKTGSSHLPRPFGGCANAATIAIGLFRQERLVGSTNGARTPNLRPGLPKNHGIIIRRLSPISGMGAVVAIPVDGLSREPLG